MHTFKPQRVALHTTISPSACPNNKGRQWIWAESCVEGVPAPHQTRIPRGPTDSPSQLTYATSNVICHVVSGPFFYSRVETSNYFANKDRLVCIKLGEGSVCFSSPKRGKCYMQPHAGKQLNLPREKDPDDRIEYVWVYIIWKSNQNVNFTGSEKSNWFHVHGPRSSPGAAPSTWSARRPEGKPQHDTEGMFPAAVPSLAPAELLNCSIR